MPVAQLGAVKRSPLMHAYPEVSLTKKRSIESKRKELSGLNSASHVNFNLPRLGFFASREPYG
jgi:hypothetical protein